MRAIGRSLGYLAILLLAGVAGACLANLVFDALRPSVFGSTHSFYGFMGAFSTVAALLIFRALR